MFTQLRSAATPNVQSKIDDMNAGWRNEVATKLGMDPSTFQLTQGLLGLQTSDSSGLFNMADAVPPLSAIACYDPSGKNTRSTAYNQLLHALLPTNSSGLADKLGPKYVNWIQYRNGDTSSKTQEELFKFWADRNLDPNQACAYRKLHPS